MRQVVLAGHPLTRLQMTFTTTAHLYQTLRLVLQEQQFEVVSEEGKEVPFGSAAEATWTAGLPGSRHAPVGGHADPRRGEVQRRQGADVVEGRRFGIARDDPGRLLARGEQR